MPGHQMNGYILIGIFASEQHFQELGQITQLIRLTHIRILYNNFLRTSQIWTEQFVIRDSTLVFDQFPLLSVGLCRKTLDWSHRSCFLLPRYGQGIGVLRSTGFALATRNRLGITSNKRFRLDFIFRILNYTPTPIQLRVVELFQRLHGDYFAIARTLVSELDFLHGGVDAAQLVFDTLAALDGTTQ